MPRKTDINEPISLKQWKRMRHGRGYESFHRSLDAYINILAGNLSEAIRNAWEIYLCQLVDECMGADEDSIGAPLHVPRAFGMMEWDLGLVSRLMDWVEGGDYTLVYAMNSDDTTLYLTGTCDEFIRDSEGDTAELVQDAIELARRLDYEAEKEKRRKGAADAEAR